MGLLDSTTQKTYYNASNRANYGDYQFITLENIIANFQVAYVGEGKIISKASINDIRFHGMRGIQEFSYDILKSVKSQEISVPNTLQMILPQDYVNYVKLTISGSDGIKRNLYPTSKTSNPFSIRQDSNGEYLFGTVQESDFRVITIDCDTGDNMNDGDNISLNFLDSSNTKDDVFFVFDLSTNDDVTSGAIPSSGTTNPRFFVQYQSNHDKNTVGNLLAKQINDFGKHTATNNNGVVTVVYKDTIASYTEFAKNAGGGTASNLSIAVVSDGALTSGLSSNDNIYGNGISATFTNFKTHQNDYDVNTNNDYETDDDIIDAFGRRYGLDPQHAQQNGTFYIDYTTGHINFSSSLLGKTIILDYISDGLGTDDEMIVHKFAEEAIYKWIAYGIIASKSNMPEYIVQRFKKEKFAEARNAKIRLSRIKIEEFTQVLKGLSKPIK